MSKVFFKPSLGYFQTWFGTQGSFQPSLLSSSAEELSNNKRSPSLAEPLADTPTEQKPEAPWWAFPWSDSCSWEEQHVHHSRFLLTALRCRTTDTWVLPQIWQQFLCLRNVEAESSGFEAFLCGSAYGINAKAAAEGREWGLGLLLITLAPICSHFTEAQLTL